MKRLLSFITWVALAITVYAIVQYANQPINQSLTDDPIHTAKCPDCLKMGLLHRDQFAWYFND